MAAVIEKQLAKNIEAGNINGNNKPEEVTNLNEAPVQTQLFWLIVWMANNVLGNSFLLYLPYTILTLYFLQLPY